MVPSLNRYLWHLLGAMLLRNMCIFFFKLPMVWSKPLKHTLSISIRLCWARIRGSYSKPQYQAYANRRWPPLRPYLKPKSCWQKLADLCIVVLHVCLLFAGKESTRSSWGSSSRILLQPNINLMPTGGELLSEPTRNRKIVGKSLSTCAYLSFLSVSYLQEKNLQGKVLAWLDSWAPKRAFRCPWFHSEVSHATTIRSLYTLHRCL